MESFPGPREVSQNKDTVAMGALQCSTADAHGRQAAVADLTRGQIRKSQPWWYANLRMSSRGTLAGVRPERPFGNASGSGNIMPKEAVEANLSSDCFIAMVRTKRRAPSARVTRLIAPCEVPRRSPFHGIWATIRPADQYHMNSVAAFAMTHTSALVDLGPFSCQPDTR